ncbi:MAG TPA: shikimate dehydrogenase [Candidatus Dormibacteraeota bacterium]|nr:shikimate dehydrogenase [Candidatus Dormibacteraeota bacterium]
MVEVGLVGDPVAYSLSPTIQKAAFAACGLDWEYQLVQVPAGRLEAAWSALSERFYGINVTSPHKEEAARLADRLTPSAGSCASVNTITFGRDGVLGDSTDGAGFMAALRRSVGRIPGSAVIVGTGGAARAVASALAEEGTQVVVLGRNGVAGGAISGQLSAAGRSGVEYRGHSELTLAESLQHAELLVNATTLGGPAFPDVSPVPDRVPLDPRLIVFDLVYWPRRTPLQLRAESAGCRLVDGLDMLVEQGALAFQAWTGLAAPLSEMRQAARLAGEDPR